MLTKKDIINATLEELTKELTKAKREQVKTNFLIRTGQSKAIHEGKKSKVYIARLSTQITALRKKQQTEEQNLANKPKEEENFAEQKS